MRNPKDSTTPPAWPLVAMSVLALVLLRLGRRLWIAGEPGDLGGDD